jgi:hypothetical protein
MFEAVLTGQSMSLGQWLGLTYGIKAPYAASLLPMTTKLQNAAPLR